MAVNLDTLLPQVFPQPSPPVVPSNSGEGEETLFGDLFSHSSMYGNALLAGGAPDSLDFDPALLKSDFFALSDGSDPLYQTNTSGELSLCTIRRDLV